MTAVERSPAIYDRALADGIQFQEGELYLPDLHLWLDSRRRRLRAFVSHAHTDHMAAHRLSFLTDCTERFFHQRMGRRATVAIPFHEPRPLAQSTIEFIPAGHILGSAQLLITDPAGRRLVYTGDFKLRARPGVEPGDVVQADVVIMEATYGHPRWRFQDRAFLEQQLVSAIERAFDRGQQPIVLAYALGKAQEALCLLSRHGLRVAVHASVAEYLPTYEAYGTVFGPYEALDLDAVEGRVLLVPMGCHRTAPFRAMAATYTIFLSGWGLDPRSKYRYGVDEVLPLSDHADFDELVEYVEGSRARRVYTVHGSADFARYLSTQGIEAYHLPDHQPSLFDSL